MKEGFDWTGCSTRGEKGCEDGAYCLWNAATSTCSLNIPCMTLTQKVCQNNPDKCFWNVRVGACVDNK